jgi:quercetin dioxygenase-like cupin family protein
LAIVEQLEFVPCDDDPDDYRPASTWAVAIDPRTPGNDYVEGMTLFVDHVAAGDRVPLHTHDIDELVIVQDGSAEVRVGDDVRVVPKGAVLFVPAGVAHGGGAHGGGVVFVGVFASPLIGTTYLERNPTPGTEDDSPQPPSIFDARRAAETS